MATLQVLLDDLNQRLGDASNADGVGEATKIRWLASGIRAMWPKVYRTLVDSSSLAIVDLQYEYAIPSTFDDAEIFRVEVQVGPSLERWARVDDYVIDRRESKTLVFRELPGIVGADLRIHALAPSVVPTSAVSVAAFVTAAGDFTGGASEDLFTAAAHGLVDGDRLVLIYEAAAGVVTGAVGDIFYANRLTADTFQISLTDGGAAVENSADGAAVFEKLASTTVSSAALDFPDRFNELPVWYALGVAMQGGHQDRLDYSRYSTVAARNGVDVAELMSSAQFCFSQFELLLERLAMPWPAG